MIEATPIAYTRCAMGRCKESAHKRVVYRGVTKLICDKHLKQLAEEMGEAIKFTVVKFDEPVLKLPPIVGRNPENDGANCWNFRDPEVQKKVEKQRAREGNKKLEKLDDVLEQLKAVVNTALMFSEPELLVYDGVTYEVIAGYACRRNSHGHLIPSYICGEDKKLGYIKFDEFDNLEIEKQYSTDISGM